MVRIKAKPIKSLPQTVTANGAPKYSIYVIPPAIERKNSIVVVSPQARVRCYEGETLLRTPFSVYLRSFASLSNNQY